MKMIATGPRVEAPVAELVYRACRQDRGRLDLARFEGQVAPPAPAGLA